MSKTVVISNIYVYTFCLCKFIDIQSFADAFGESGRPASGDEGAVPPNAYLQLDLELVSWKTVSDITKDRKVLKKTLKEGEGYERPNDGAVVQGTVLIQSFRTLLFLSSFKCFVSIGWDAEEFHYFLCFSETDWQVARWNCFR